MERSSGSAAASAELPAPGRRSAAAAPATPTPSSRLLRLCPSYSALTATARREGGCLPWGLLPGECHASATPLQG